MQRPALTPERVLALAGVTGLLLVGLVSLIMVIGAASGSDDEEPVLAATATATPSPTATAKPSPTPVPLTAEQKAERTAAAEVVRSRGFDVVRLKDYNPRKTLRVLIGRQTGGDGHLAFFFVNGDYIGNDSTEPSGRLKVRKAGDLQVTLEYATTTGATQVRFKWDGARLAPLDAVPAPSVRAPGTQ